MALSAGVLGIFEQLYLLEGLKGVSKPINDFKLFSNELKSIGHLKGKEEKDQYVPLSHLPANEAVGFKAIPHFPSVS